MNPLLHYLKFGQKKGKKAFKVYTNYYGSGIGKNDIQDKNKLELEYGYKIEDVETIEEINFSKTSDEFFKSIYLKRQFNPVSVISFSNISDNAIIILLIQHLGDIVACEPV
ncbi:MAG: hypothetical protein LBF97_02675 [Elusimicrobiota bacterium]|jgi:hypothetical protein|nr:hypothetical protein [Elusimicrobiota bacterium]